MKDRRSATHDAEILMKIAAVSLVCIALGLTWLLVGLSLDAGAEEPSEDMVMSVTVPDEDLVDFGVAPPDLFDFESMARATLLSYAAECDEDATCLAITLHGADESKLCITIEGSGAFVVDEGCDGMTADAIEHFLIVAVGPFPNRWKEE